MIFPILAAVLMSLYVHMPHPIEDTELGREGTALPLWQATRKQGLDIDPNWRSTSLVDLVGRSRT